MEIALLEYAAGEMAYPEAARIAQEYGFCLDYPIIAQPFENPSIVLEHCAQMRRDRGEAALREELSTIRNSQREGMKRRTLARSSLLARTPTRYRDWIKAIAEVLCLAATEEEERHLLEMRAVRDFRLLIQQKDMDPMDVIEEEALDAYNAPKMHPRGWYDKKRWPLIYACVLADK
jgi:hypothetical protein